MAATKTYRAQIELGVTTDTYDAEGRVIQKKDPSPISREQLESALNSFRGSIRQTPPMYSAVKHHGQPLYKLARAGINVARKSRTARIHRLELTDWQPPLATLEVICGKGTYIRSLAHDLGQSLGCGASLRSLIRLRYGPFDIAEAISLPQVEDAFRLGYGQNFIYPIDSVLLDWPAVVVNDEMAQAVVKGQPVRLKKPGGAKTRGYCRAYATDGHFLGVLHYHPAREQWQPERIFSREFSRT
jgi:tRNA pseudouridine55 synthase